MSAQPIPTTEDAICPRCKEPAESFSVEAFEVLDELICSDCFEAACEEEDA